MKIQWFLHNVDYILSFEKFQFKIPSNKNFTLRETSLCFIYNSLLVNSVLILFIDLRANKNLLPNGGVNGMADIGLSIEES